MIEGTNDSPTAFSNTALVVDESTPVDTGNLITDNDGVGADQDLDGPNLQVTAIATGAEAGPNGTPVLDPAVDVVGNYGNLDWANDGSYTYNLNSDAANVNALGEGQTATETFTYTMGDHTTLVLATPTTSTGTAGTVLGTGDSALLGGDLTDPEGNGFADEDAGYNASFSANDEPGFGGGEFSFNVFDNRTGGGTNKWCCNSAGGTTPDGNGLWVAAEFDQPYVLTHFTITSSNDSPDRDPRVWEIQGSNDGVNWTTVFAYTDTSASPFTARNQVLLYTSASGRTDLTGGATQFESSTGYTHLRYFVDSTGNNNHALGELEFFGRPEVEDSAELTVTITGANDAPYLVTQPDSSTGIPDQVINEDGTLTLNVSSYFDDVDTIDGLVFDLTGVTPTGDLVSVTDPLVATLDPSTGLLTVTLPAHAAGVADLTIRARDVDPSLSSTDPNYFRGTEVSSSFQLTVNPVADAPLLEVEPIAGVVGQPVPMGIETERVDQDGSEGLAVTIADIPAGATVTWIDENGDPQTFTPTPDPLDPTNLLDSLTVTTTDPADLQDLLDSMTLTLATVSAVELVVTATAQEGGDTSNTASTTVSLAAQAEELPVFGFTLRSDARVGDNPLLAPNQLSEIEIDPVTLARGQELAGGDDSGTPSDDVEEVDAGKDVGQHRLNVLLAASRAVSRSVNAGQQQPGLSLTLDGEIHLSSEELGFVEVVRRLVAEEFAPGEYRLEAEGRQQFDFVLDVTAPLPDGVLQFLNNYLVELDGLNLDGAAGPEDGGEAGTNTESGDAGSGDAAPSAGSVGLLGLVGGLFGGGSKERRQKRSENDSAE